MKTKKVKKYIEVRTKFSALHRWKDAPEEVAFLRDFHRHEFNVEMRFPVQDSDREIEFFIMKKKIDKYLDYNYEGGQFDMSCEMIAEELLNKFNAVYCLVREDDQNASIVIYE